jgi:hypothetical protein
MLSFSLCCSYALQHRIMARDGGHNEVTHPVHTLINNREKGTRDKLHEGQEADVRNVNERRHASVFKQHVNVAEQQWTTWGGRVMQAMTEIKTTLNRREVWKHGPLEDKMNKMSSKLEEQF